MNHVNPYTHYNTHSTTTTTYDCPTAPGPVSTTNVNCPQPAVVTTVGPWRQVNEYYAPVFKHHDSHVAHYYNQPAHIVGHSAYQVGHVVDHAAHDVDHLVDHAISDAQRTGHGVRHSVKTALSTPVHFLRGAAERVTGDGSHPRGRHHLSDHMTRHNPRDIETGPVHYPPAVEIVPLPVAVVRPGCR